MTRKVDATAHDAVEFRLTGRLRLPVIEASKKTRRVKYLVFAK